MQKLYFKVINKKKHKIENNSLRVKHRYQLVVKLKANKCYQKLLYYLFFYIHFLSIKFS